MPFRVIEFKLGLLEVVSVTDLTSITVVRHEQGI